MRALPVFIAVSFALLFPAGLVMAQALPCKAAQMVAAEDRKESDEIDGGLGHFAMTFAVRNRSLAECVLAGEPVVTLFGKADRPLAVRFCHSCSEYLFYSQPVERVLLKPNGTAYLVIGYDVDDGAGICRDALTIGIRLPKDAATLKIGVAPAGQAMRSCGRIDVTPFLRKPPVDGSLARRDSAETGR